VWSSRYGRLRRAHAGSSPAPAGGPDLQNGRKIFLTGYDSQGVDVMHTPPYDQALLDRFLDTETKSNGSPAATGVVWRMPAADKADLFAYLQTL